MKNLKKKNYIFMALFLSTSGIVQATEQKDIFDEVLANFMPKVATLPAPDKPPAALPTISVTFVETSTPPSVPEVVAKVEAKTASQALNHKEHTTPNTGCANPVVNLQNSPSPQEVSDEESNDKNSHSDEVSNDKNSHSMFTQVRSFFSGLVRVSREQPETIEQPENCNEDLSMPQRGVGSQAKVDAEIQAADRMQEVAAEEANRWEIADAEAQERATLKREWQEILEQKNAPKVPSLFNVPDDNFPYSFKSFLHTLANPIEEIETFFTQSIEQNKEDIIKKLNTQRINDHEDIGGNEVQIARIEAFVSTAKTDEDKIGRMIYLSGLYLPEEIQQSLSKEIATFYDANEQVLKGIRVSLDGSLRNKVTALGDKPEKDYSGFMEIGERTSVQNLGIFLTPERCKPIPENKPPQPSTERPRARRFIPSKRAIILACLTVSATVAAFTIRKYSFQARFLKIVAMERIMSAWSSIKAKFKSLKRSPAPKSPVVDQPAVVHLQPIPSEIPSRVDLSVDGISEEVNEVLG